MTIGLTDTAFIVDAGTISAAGDTVTGTGTAWLIEGVRPGDVILTTTRVCAVKEVVSNTSLKTAPAIGTVAAATAYAVIRLPGDSAELSALTRELLGRFGALSLDAVRTSAQTLSAPAQAQARSNIGAAAAGPFTAEASGPRFLATGTFPTLALQASNAPVNNRRAEFIALASGAIQARFLDDANSTATAWLDVTRSGNTAVVINLIGTAARINGNNIWHAGNLTPANYALLAAADFTGGLTFQGGTPVAPRPTAAAALGQWSVINVANAYSLPAGGTWAHWSIRTNTSTGAVDFIYSGVAAGGTVILATSGFHVRGIAWRIV
jgi:hypothetical protein